VPDGRPLAGDGGVVVVRVGGRGVKAHELYLGGRRVVARVGATERDMRHAVVGDDERDLRSRRERKASRSEHAPARVVVLDMAHDRDAAVGGHVHKRSVDNCAPTRRLMEERKLERVCGAERRGPAADDEPPGAVKAHHAGTTAERGGGEREVRVPCVVDCKLHVCGVGIREARLADVFPAIVGAAVGAAAADADQSAHARTAVVVEVGEGDEDLFARRANGQTDRLRTGRRGRAATCERPPFVSLVRERDDVHGSCLRRMVRDDRLASA
jgi:hypothetical protein